MASQDPQENKAIELSTTKICVEDREEKLIKRFREITTRYEIRQDFCNSMLKHLRDFEIVLLCDDSGSMNSTIFDPTNPSKKVRRWDELHNYVKISLDLLATLDSNGIDIYFMNRNPVYNVTEFTPKIDECFRIDPIGYTPTVDTLNRIFIEKKSSILEKKLLIILLTDGVPTDKDGMPQNTEFENCLRNRHSNIYISIVACTDDENIITFLDKIDKIVPAVDVNDDYRSEKAQIQKVQGPKFAFSFGDYVAKTMLGSIVPTMDKLDEEKLPNGTIDQPVAVVAPAGLVDLKTTVAPPVTTSVASTSITPVHTSAPTTTVLPSQALTQMPTGLTQPVIVITQQEPQKIENGCCTIM